MADTSRPTSEASQEPGGFMDRVKHVVGLGPKEHKLDISEHETDVSPHGEDVETRRERTLKDEELMQTSTKESSVGTAAAARSPLKEEQPALEAPSPSEEARVQPQKLLKPQEVEVGMEKPKLSTPTELEKGETPAPAMQTTTKESSPSTPLPYERVTAESESKGYHRVEGTAMKTESNKTEKLSEPTQGDSVKVNRIGGGYAYTPTTPAVSGVSPLKGQVEEVYARPEHEVAPLGAAEVAEIKATEHQIVADESHRVAAAKHRELEQLRRQAETLEQQSEKLMKEAEVEKRRVEVAHLKAKEIERGERGAYHEAEQAELERRAVVERAKPAARTAAERDQEAVLKKQDAADAEFHAQVLENRARSLLKESEEMAALSMELSLEAGSTASKLTLVRQEAEELKAQINTQATRGLPEYINECQKEIGALSHRIAQLREEIAWADGEVERGNQEAETWRRVVVAKEGQAARLLLQLNQLNEDAAAARMRSRAAAEEARIPTQLAEQKYEEAWQAAREAQKLEEEAKEAQLEALEVVKEAVGPEQERQRALREAAAAEIAAVQLETKAEVVAGKAKRRLYEAEVKESTAAAMAEEAQHKEMEEARHVEIQEAEEQLAETYRTQKETHRPIEVPAV